MIMFKKILSLSTSFMIVLGSMASALGASYSIKSVLNQSVKAFKKTTTLDLDQDGKKEQMTMAGDYDKKKACYNAFHLVINKHEHLIKKGALQNGRMTAGSIKLSVMKMKNKTYLYLKTGSYGDDAFFKGYLYTYDSANDSLKCVLMPGTDLYNKASYIVGGEINNVKANSFDFSGYIAPTEIGMIKVTYRFLLKNNKLLRKNYYCTVKGKSSYKVYRPLTFYKKVNSKAVAFKAKKNAKVKLIQGYVRKGTVALQFKLGSKSGWCKCSYQSFDKIYKNSTNYWFYNTGSYFGG